MKQVEDCNGGRGKKEFKTQVGTWSFHTTNKYIRYLLTCFKLAFFAPDPKPWTKDDLQHYLSKIVGSKFWISNLDWNYR